MMCRSCSITTKICPMLVLGGRCRRCNTSVFTMMIVIHFTSFTGSTILVGENRMITSLTGWCKIYIYI